MKILGMVLAVSLVIFAIAPIASAQTYAGILHDQWFKVNLALKGYVIDGDGETVLGKGVGSGETYLWMAYNDIDGYTIVTCTQDATDDSKWYQKMMAAPLSVDNIYGATYPQVWDFQGNPLQLYNGAETFNVYPTFYTKITAEGDILKKATITNVACAFYANLENGEYVTGSCTIKGTLVLAAKVATTVPALCLPGP